VTADELFDYINTKTGRDLTYFFHQYFRKATIPVLETHCVKQGDETTLQYRWVAEVQDFSMPVKVTTGTGKYEFIHPTAEWQTLSIGDMDPREFRVADDLFYIDTKLTWAYLDPRKKDSSFIRR
jgi:hypothetical protein